MTVIKIRNESHWRELRRENVGSSDVSALFDENPYLTLFELYHTKLNPSLDDFDSDRMYWGRLLEDDIGQAVRDKTGWKIEKSQNYYTDDKTERMGCTPDFEIIEAEGRPGKGVFEAKNVDFFEFREVWINEEPPLNYILQLQQQLACTGFKWGIIAVLIGGNELRIYEYKAHGGAIAKIRAAVKKFWKIVKERKEPSAASEDYDFVKQLYPIRKGIELDLSKDNELPWLCERFLDANHRRLKMEKEEKGYKAEIIRKLQGAQTAYCNGFVMDFPEIDQNMQESQAHVRTYRKLTVKQLEN